VVIARVVKSGVLVLLVVGAVLVGACERRTPERPLEGAPPVAESTPVRITGEAVPTLAPPAALSGSPPPVGSPDQLTASSVPSPSPSPSPVPGFVIVATDGAGVNLRTAPSTAAAVITTIREGTPVEVLGDPVSAEGRPWRQIRAGGREGWVVAVTVRPR